MSSTRTPAVTNQRLLGFHRSSAKNAKMSRGRSNGLLFASATNVSLKFSWSYSKPATKTSVFDTRTSLRVFAATRRLFVKEFPDDSEVNEKRSVSTLTEVTCWKRLENCSV